MTKIKKNEKLGTYYFVHEAGRDLLTGKRVQIKRSGFKTEAEAKRVLKQIILELGDKNEPIAFKVKRAYFQDFALEWLGHKKIVMQRGTFLHTEQALRNSVFPYIGEKRIGDIDNNVLQLYITELSKKRTVNGKIISPHTVHRIWKIVREILKKAASLGAFNKEYLEHLYLPRLNKTSAVWGEKEIATFLEAPFNVKRLSRHYIGMAMPVLTGMRMAEILGLRWQDISFEDKIISINQTLVIDEDESSGTGSYKLTTRGKTDESLASIKIPDILIDLLLEHKKRIDADKKRFGKAYNDLDLVVCTKMGDFIYPANIRKTFKSLIKQMGLPEIRYHDLRHTHATFLLSKGVNAKVIQERLRHKDIKTTLGTYSHAIPQMHSDAMDKIDSIKIGQVM